MNSQSSSKKTIIVFIIILAISGLLYFYSIGTPNDSSVSSLDVTLPPELAGSNVVSSKALVLLREVSTLKIDPNFFSGAIYKSLLDYSVEVPAQNVGRTNPFLPFPGQSQTSSTKSIAPKTR